MQFSLHYITHLIFADFLNFVIFLFGSHLLQSILPVCLWIFLSISVQKEASQKMNICSIESALLSTSCGKYVCIEGRRRRRPRPSQSLELVTENRQEKDLENSAKVKVYHILYGTRKCMAFCFEVNKKSVFPVVTHGKEVKFKVLPTDKPITAGIFDQTFLFQWDEQDRHGDWKSLKSVAEPSMYLIDEENGKEKSKVIITNERSPIFKICYTDMKIAGLTQYIVKTT
ncbi:uncharacterized protein [Sinocyclocheilus grahami]|uniref:uncharacterized protein isoform X3 n=1 Tax=Sinocyclocheilus grahami TaxID=75366 RepID=UPI0007AC656E|nr:PREDICTED: uncharacterized protein LOC107599602 isoform X3 [Sinocyclocheilus grahami]